VRVELTLPEGKGILSPRRLPFRHRPNEARIGREKNCVKDKKAQVALVMPRCLTPLLHRLICLAACALALGAQRAPAHAAPGPPAANCPGGRFVSTVEDVQRHNWIENTPTVYDRQETALRLPRWLGRVALTHASQGFLLSGEERLGRWTTVTVPPSVTLSGRILDRHFYLPIRLPVFKETQACRDENGDLYVR
jgi:hypothetical protein